MSFKTNTLDKLGITLIDGDRGKNYPNQSEFKSNGFCLFLSAKNITKDGLSFGETQFIDKIKDEQLRAGKLQVNDLVITTRGTIGNVAYFSKNVEYMNIRINSGMLIIRPDDTWDNHFFYYVLLSPFFKSQVLSLTSGSAVPQLPARDLKSFLLPIVDIYIQKKIAHILSTLDDKIELNRKMNQTLESMAQTLFKSWFVDFDPVKAKCKNEEELESAALELGISKEVLELFPSEFEESELGMIPKGWEVKNLGNLTNITSSKRIFSSEYVESGIPFYRSKEIIHLAQGSDSSDILYISKERFNEIKNKYLVPKEYDILITSVGTIGKIYLVPDDAPFYFKDGNLTWINSYVNITPIFVYNFLKSNGGQQQMDSVLIGSTQKALTIVNINKLRINMPSLAVLEEFTKQADSIFNQITINTKQIQTLQKTRDTLLPKLLSGELDVSDLDLEN